MQQVEEQMKESGRNSFIRADSGDQIRIHWRYGKYNSRPELSWHGYQLAWVSHSVFCIYSVSWELRLLVGRQEGNPPRKLPLQQPRMKVSLDSFAGNPGKSWKQPSKRLDTGVDRGHGSRRSWVGEAGVRHAGNVFSTASRPTFNWNSS